MSTASGMSVLRVDPQVLISTADEFQSSGSQISVLTEEMMALVTGLSALWEGEAAALYIAKFSALEDDIQKMIAMIAEHVSDLQEMAQTYIGAETTSTEYAESQVGDVII